MKPPVFDYYDPTTEDETLALLAQFGDDAKILAGGQSLMPLLNMRLVAPASVIDVNRVESFSFASIQATPEALHIGALTRQRQVERSDEVARHCPLLAEALQHVGYPQIRHRGTIGGSLVHADPAAELGAAMTAVEAEFEVRSQHGSRVLTPETFFVSYLTTALEPDELLCEIRIPHQPPRTGWSFMEIARVAGAFALVGAASLVTVQPRGLQTPLFCVHDPGSDPFLFVFCPFTTVTLTPTGNYDRARPILDQSLKVDFSICDVVQAKFN